MASTFLDAGWDFVGETANGTEDIWWIDEGKGYPRLWWEPRKYGGGTGEPNNLYQIATAADLIALGEDPNDYDKHFILTGDIDLDPNLPGRKVFDRAVIAPDTDSGTLWQWEGTAFTGVFEGNSHTISHLTIEGGGYLGLFGRLESLAEIKNLGVIDVKIAGAGGVIGGLLGGNRGSLTQCYSTGIVRGTEGVGGLVGNNSHGTVSQCYSTVAVTGIGFAWGIGGLAGGNGGRVTQSYSAGAVSGREAVGGLVGSNTYRSSITDCYSTASVSGNHDVGGLIGLNGRYAADYDGPDGVVTHCYSTGVVSGTEGHVGGLVGSLPELGVLVFDCFWDMQTSGLTESGDGTGKTTAEMQDPNTFTAAGWDFVGEIGNGTHEIWQMPEGGGYPVLAGLTGYVPHQLQGSGSLDEPYLISDVHDLGAISHFGPNAHYSLVAPIDLSDIRWSVAVIPCLSGTFDGHGHTISHLTIHGWEDLGLFGRLESGGRINDLGVVDVNITGSSGIGGLVANNSGDLIRCYCSGVIDCNWGRSWAFGWWGYDVGGMVGENSGDLTQCYSTGAVIGMYDVGGLVGYNSDGTVSQCYSASEVNGYRVGGLVGYNYGTVTQCYSVGEVNGYHIGGLISSSDGQVTGCFWDMETSGQTTSEGGTGKTTAEMQKVATFLDAGWDFVGETANGTQDIWWIREGQDYPRLWWENHSN